MRTARSSRSSARRRCCASVTSSPPPGPAEELHELRKDAKKLRYLLECFGSLYSPRPRKEFVQRLKALQDNLGEHQDTEVHVGELRTISSELHGAQESGPRRWSPWAGSPSTWNAAALPHGKSSPSVSRPTTPSRPGGPSKSSSTPQAARHERPRPGHA